MEVVEIPDDPPGIYSTDANSPGFMNYSKACFEGKTIKVFLDGEEIKCVTFADANAGIVRRDCVDKNGLLRLNHETKAPVTEELHGDVRIEITQIKKQDPSQ